MKRFNCACGQGVFFENSACIRCGARLGFEPARLEQVSLVAVDGGWQDAGGRFFRLCRDGLDHHNCNWLVPGEDPDAYPFVIPAPAAAKLRFMHSLLQGQV